jgi:hypothetical protein
MFGNGILITPVPIPWAFGDIIVYTLLIIMAVYMMKKSSHPQVILMEFVAFCFLYAGIYENAAGVVGAYNFGRSIVSIGNVPFSIPAIEVMVMLTGLWMLDKMQLPKWSQPIILAMFGFVQDLTLDPLAVKQIFTVNGVTSSRWNWIIDSKSVTIFNVPVYNFPGWCLIMGYSSALLLLGRYLFKKFEYRKSVGYVYPFIAMPVALLLMKSPISRFLLYGEPFGHAKTNSEWVFFILWLVVPILILVFVWKGKMKEGLSLKSELPIFLIPTVLHLTNIFFTIYGHYWDILLYNIIISAVHIGFLGFVLYRGKKLPAPTEEYSLRF